MAKTTKSTGNKAKAAGPSVGASTPVKLGAAPRVGNVVALSAEAKKAGTAALKRGLALLLLISRRKARIAEDFYEIGEALREIQKEKLYIPLGHASFGELLKARDVFGLSQAKKLIQIVTSMPRDKALSVGAEKAYALARYTAATPDLDTPSSLLDADAPIGGKSAGEITVREIVREAGKVRAKTAGPRPKGSGRAEGQGGRPIHAGRAPKAGSQKATVTHRRTQDGYWLRIDIPVDAAASLVDE